MRKNIPAQFFVFLTGITFCLFLFGLGEKLSFLTNNFGRIFAWVPGDIFDGSLNNWFLENNLQYFLRGGNIFNIKDVFNTGIYWPAKNTMAMSVNWLFLSPFYALIRLILSPAYAFTAIICLSLTANVMACFRICRHATDKKFFRLVAAFLSGFSLTVLARLGHGQLMPAFAGVLAIDSFLDALHITNTSDLQNNIDKNSKNKVLVNEISFSSSKIFTGVIWLLIQIGIGFYQGVFFSIATLSILSVILFERFINKNLRLRVINNDYISGNRSKYIFSLKLFIFSLLVILNGLIYNQYFLYSRLRGGRSWGEVSVMIPKIWSLFFNTLSNTNSVSLPAPIQSVTYPGPFWEHSMFPGYTFYVIISFGILFGLKKTFLKGENAIRKWRVMTLSKATLVMLLISLGIGGVNPVLTIWLFFWKLIPGISALRAVSRIGIPIVLLLSPLIAWSLSELYYRLNKKDMTILSTFLLILFLTGNITKGIKRFDSLDYEMKINSVSSKIEKIVKEKNCKVFYLKSPDTKNWMYDRVHPQMMASWTSLRIGIPTSSGYSGSEPAGWTFSFNETQYNNWLKNYGIDEEFIKNESCWINGEDVL